MLVTLCLSIITVLAAVGAINIHLSRNQKQDELDNIDWLEIHDEDDAGLAVDEVIDTALRITSRLARGVDLSAKLNIGCAIKEYASRC